MKNKEEVGKIIAESRMKKNITQVELAKKINVTDKAISNWETGKNLPDREIIKELEKVLDIKINEEIEKPIYIKRNKLLLILLSTITIFFIFLLIYFISNYNKFNIYQISLDSNTFKIDNSYLTVSNKTIILNLNKISLINSPYEPNLKVSLYYEDKELITKHNYNNLTISETKDNYVFLSKDILNNLDNLHLMIEYQDIENNLTKEDINFKYNKISSNDKFIYQKNKSKEIRVNQNLLNLLKNNNYKKINKYLYEKKINNIIYQYDVIDNVLKINYCNDYCVNATYYSKIAIDYIVVKNNKIIEYRLDRKYNDFKYRDEIENIIKNEILKLETSKQLDI